MKPKTVGIFVILSLAFSVACAKLTEEQLVERAKLQEKEQKYDEALETYQQIVRNYPKGESAPEAQYKVGWIYYNENKDFENAVAAHEKLVKDYPNSRFAEQSRFMIGYIYANDLRDLSKARAAYEDFLKHHPKSELADDVTWELDHLGQDINLLDFVGKDEGKGSDGKAANGGKPKN